MDLIFHVTAAADWMAAQSSGAYQLSTRDRSLEDVGFIHSSYISQVTRVANLIYKGAHGLVLLVIERQRLTAPVRDENVDGGRERFPHIYGPLNLDAVVEVLPFEPQADGTFALPSHLQTPP